VRGTTLTGFIKDGEQKSYYTEGSQAAPARLFGKNLVNITWMYYRCTAPPDFRNSIPSLQRYQTCLFFW